MPKYSEKDIFKQWQELVTKAGEPGYEESKPIAWSGELIGMTVAEAVDDYPAFRDRVLSIEAGLGA